MGLLCLYNTFLKVLFIRYAVTLNLFLLAAIQGDWNCIVNYDRCENHKRVIL